MRITLDTGETILGTIELTDQDKASDLPAEVQAELIHGALTDHYRKTLDEPIPTLEDLSPRAAVQSAAGRRKVVDWLKHIENQSKSGGRLTIRWPAMTSLGSGGIWA